MCSASDCLVEGTCSEEAAKGNKRSKFPSTEPLPPPPRSAPPFCLVISRRLRNAQSGFASLFFFWGGECTAYICQRRELLISVAPRWVLHVSGTLDSTETRALRRWNANASSDAAAQERVTSGQDAAVDASRCPSTGSQTIPRTKQ